MGFHPNCCCQGQVPWRRTCFPLCPVCTDAAIQRDLNQGALCCWLSVLFLFIIFNCWLKWVFKMSTNAVRIKKQVGTLENQSCTVLLVCLVMEQSLLTPFQVKALLVSVSDELWVEVGGWGCPMVCGDNTHSYCYQHVPMSCGHKCSAVLPFAFLSAPGCSFTPEDTVIPATMSFKDILTLNYLERAWCLPSWAGWSLLLWLSSTKTRSPFSNSICAGHAGWWQIHNFIF